MEIYEGKKRVGLLTGKCVPMVYIHFVVRKNRWSISFGGAKRLSSLTSFTDTERYYIKISIEVLTMDLAQTGKADFWLSKMVVSEAERSQVFCRI